jgi:adenylate cyclase
MSTSRQLAAIMFTDIQGYTAFMQENEDRAISLKDRHREVIEQEHEHFHGRIVNYYGDGTVSIFQSAVEAVLCALAMQQAFQTDPKVPVRIGIHLGDIIINDNQIFGDGVNLASRVESLGVPGSVLLSEKLNDEISNQPEIKTVSVGSYQFKNVKRAVEVFALAHEGLVVPPFNSLTGKTEEKKTSKIKKKLPPKSVAVLPFANMSNDPEQDYFSEGIGEEILNSLAAVKELKVASRTSSLQFHGKKIDLYEVAEKLGVSTVLEGSVRKHGDRLRIVVQLINVENGFHLWSERYDRFTDDIFTIQDEIAQAVTEKLKVTLLGKPSAKLIRSKTSNTEAYELYLKGRFHTNRRGPSIMTGIHYFQLAIDLDPNFALAHSGFADANFMAAFYGMVPSNEVIYKAKEAAEKAIRLDPTLCEPYCSLGCYYACFGWDWVAAEKNFLKSIELNPKYSQALYWYGSLFLAWGKGDFKEAEKYGKQATKVEPLSSICHGMYASILHTCGKYTQALAAAKRSVELDPYSFVPYFFMGWSYLGLKQYKEAIQTFEHLMQISNRHHFAHNALIIAYAASWKFSKARELLAELKERSKKEYITFTAIAFSSGCLNELDEAFAYFEKAYLDHDPILLSIKYESWVPDAIRDDERFDDLLEKIGFPEEQHSEVLV